MLIPDGTAQSVAQAFGACFLAVNAFFTWRANVVAAGAQRQAVVNATKIDDVHAIVNSANEALVATNQRLNDRLADAAFRSTPPS